MTRVAGWTGTDGGDRSSASVNTVATALITASASIDGTNLAAEGLDARNIDPETVVEMGTAGTRNHFGRWATDITLQGDGVTDKYRNEGIVPVVMTTNVELDWSAAQLTLAANEYLDIQAVVTFGQSTDYGFENGGAVPAGVSAILLVDIGTGYLQVSSSRHGRGGYSLSAAGAPAAGDTIVGDAFDLTPTCIFHGPATVKKIGVAVGVGQSNLLFARASRAQITTCVKKKSL